MLKAFRGDDLDAFVGFDVELLRQWTLRLPAQIEGLLLSARQAQRVGVAPRAKRWSPDVERRAGYRRAGGLHTVELAVEGCGQRQ